VSLLVVRAMAGAAGGVLSGAAVAYIGDYFPYQRRGWANGWVMTGMAFGHIIGIPAGTVLAAHFGFRMPYLGLRRRHGRHVPRLVWRVVPQPDVERAADRSASAAPCAAMPAAALARHPGGRRHVRRHVPRHSLFVIYLPTWLEDSIGASRHRSRPCSSPAASRTCCRGRAPAASPTASAAGASSSAPASACAAHPRRHVRRPARVVAFVVFFFVMMLFAARIGPFQALLTQLVRPSAAAPS
jgi:MFS family permease